jgi:hypothetical protein
MTLTPWRGFTRSETGIVAFNRSKARRCAYGLARTYVYQVVHVVEGRAAAEIPVFCFSVPPGICCSLDKLKVCLAISIAEGPRQRHPRAKATTRQHEAAGYPEGLRQPALKVRGVFHGPILRIMIP